MNRLLLRSFGILLMLAPFLNFFVSIAMLPANPNKWTWAYLSAVFLAASPMQWALRTSKVVIGYLMFKGKSSAWLPVLIILVVTIAYNFLTFSRDFRTNSFQAVTSILINFVLFGLVLNAEIKSQKELNAKLAAARAARAQATPPPPVDTSVSSSNAFEAEADNVVPLPIAETITTGTHTSTEEPAIELEFQIAKGSQIDFEGHGQFAEVVHCHDDEIWIRGTGVVPVGITSETLILESSENGATVRLQFSRHDSSDVMIFKIA